MVGAGAPAFRIGRPRSPGSGGPSLRRAVGQVGIVLRQVRQAIRGIAVVGAVEFGANRLALRLKREKQRTADPERGDRAEADEDLARETGHRRASRAKAHLARRPLAPFAVAGRRRIGSPSLLRPPVGPDNSDLLLLLSAEAQLGRGEQTVDDHVWSRTR